MGKGGDNKNSPRSNEQVATEQWVKIEDTLYDVQNFAKRHPGGNVIKFALYKNGTDATDVYKEFHMRSAKADKVLKALPKRAFKVGEDAAPTGTTDMEDEDAMLADFRVFRQKLVDDGYFTPIPSHVAYRIVEVAVLFAFSLYLLNGGHFWSSLMGLTLIGLFGGRCGWIQHEGGHNSLTGNCAIDKELQAFFIGFGLSSSGSMWNAMHQKHHATPQKVQHDLDIDTTPLVAFFNDALEKRFKKTPYSVLWLKFQALTFVPVTSGMVVMAFWLFYLHPRQVIRKQKWNEGFWMITSHIVKTALIANLTGMSTGSAYACFWYTRWIAGMYLFGNFSLSHTHCDIVDKDENKNWVEYAVHHTVDIEPGTFWVDWWMGYLNCQVIHHLFPAMPQCNQPEVSRLFEKFCKKWNLRYTKVSYWEAWRLMLQNLQDVGQHIVEKDAAKKSVKAE